MLRPNDIARAACILRDDLNNWRKRGLQLDADQVKGGGWSVYTEADALRVAAVAAMVTAKVQVSEATAIMNERFRYVAAVMDRKAAGPGPYIVVVTGFIPGARVETPNRYSVFADDMSHVIEVIEKSQSGRDELGAVKVHWQMIDLGTLADMVRRRLDIEGYDDGVSKE